MSKSIKIFNVRDGFANNSSSTHSIIFSSETKEFPESYDAEAFGWEYFTVSSKTGVIDYLRGVLASNFSYKVHRDYVEAIVDNWTGTKTEDGLPSVDHQSVISLPKNFDGKHINKQFFMELKELFMTENTLILGGNDNDDDVHYLSAVDGTKPHFKVESDYVGRKDEKYGYWTFFNRNNGYKFRFILNQNGEDEVFPEKSSAPELVDLKITDNCNFNCSFCFPPGVEITTDNTKIDIKDIRIGDIVKTYQVENNIEQYHKVEQLFVRQFDGELITIELENEVVISLTENHPVFTNRGYIRADELTLNDIVLYIE